MATASDSSIRSTCHCGAITVIVPRLPEYLNECQCTICRRYAAAWAYYKTDEVKVETKPNAVTKKYLWGDKHLSFDFCDNCGCVCYWWPAIDPPPGGEPFKMGVNTRNMNPEIVKHIDRRVQYGVLKAPNGSKETAHPEDLAEY